MCQCLSTCPAARLDYLCINSFFSASCYSLKLSTLSSDCPLKHTFFFPLLGVNRAEASLPIRPWQVAKEPKGSNGKVHEGEEGEGRVAIISN